MGLAVWAGITLAGLTACGGGSTASPAAGQASAPAATSHSQSGTAWYKNSLDPCSLVTLDELAKAVNMKVEPGKASAAAGSRDCTFTTAAGAAGTGASEIASLTVEVVGPNPALISRFPTARSYYDFTRSIFKSSVNVSGIGDSAFLTEKDHWIYAIKGTVILRVFATFGTTGTARQVIEQVMRDALARV